MDTKTFEVPLVASSAAPSELVLLCRPQVLKLEDGTRSPGVVAQVFVTGGDDQAPVTAPDGEFSFRATTTASNGSPETWTFPSGEVPEHRIDHSLGPCYAFWLPLEPSKDAIRHLVVRASFTSGKKELASLPVRVAVPGR